MQRLAEFLHEVGHLERTPRSGWELLRTRGQSVAAHTCRVAFTAFLLARREGVADVGRVVTMALIHDLPEARTGDLHHLAQRYAHADEERALADATEGLECGGEIAALFAEYRAGATEVARIVADADQIELLLSLRERCAGDAWIPRALGRLSTGAGRELGRAIVDGDPGSWSRERGE